MKISELYEAVTATIIKDLEAGTATWIKPWQSKSGGVLPYNAATKRGYNGINIPILWHASSVNGWPTMGFMTYRQAIAANAQVRAGEKGTHVVFTKQLLVGEGDDEKKIGMLKSFTVFNQAQIDGLPQEEPVEPLTEKQRDDQATRFIESTRADIKHGGDRACYVPSKDFIVLPHSTDFESYEHYLATALHETVHWSGHETRLKRELKSRFHEKAYAAEELIAELGAAFLCAHLGVQGQLRHADYIASWLELLKDDPRAIFTAASKASQAADYLRAFSEQMEAAA